MGFMGIESIGSSDEASDFASNVIEGIRLKMEKEMMNEANEYNTSGYINIALLLKSMVSDSNEWYFTYAEEWGGILQQLEDRFEKELEGWSETIVKDDYMVLYEFIKKLNEISKDNG